MASYRFNIGIDSNEHDIAVVAGTRTRLHCWTITDGGELSTRCYCDVAEAPVKLRYSSSHTIASLEPHRGVVVRNGRLEVLTILKQKNESAIDCQFLTFGIPGTHSLAAAHDRDVLIVCYESGKIVVSAVFFTFFIFLSVEHFLIFISNCLPIYIQYLMLSLLYFISIIFILIII